MRVKDYLEECGEMVGSFFRDYCGLNNPDAEIGILGLDEVKDLSKPVVNGRPTGGFCAVLQADTGLAGRIGCTLPTLYYHSKLFAYVDCENSMEAWLAADENGKERMYAYQGDGKWEETA